MDNKEQRMNDGLTKLLPEYICHKHVHAGKITGIKRVVGQISLTFAPNPKFDDSNWMPFSLEWIEKHKPEIGGYVVWYKDGYDSYSPAKAFEEGYTKLSTVQAGVSQGSQVQVNSAELDQKDNIAHKSNESNKSNPNSAIQEALNQLRHNTLPTVAELVRDSAYMLTQALKKNGYGWVVGYAKCTVEDLNSRVMASCVSDVQFKPEPLYTDQQSTQPAQCAKPAQQPLASSIEPKPTVEPKPTIGRIVIYHHPGSADGRFPARNSPAIIQEVIDPSNWYCRIFVFGPLGQHMDCVHFGNGPCQWSWPDRS